MTSDLRIPPVSDNKPHKVFSPVSFSGSGVFSWRASPFGPPAPVHGLSALKGGAVMLKDYVEYPGPHEILAMRDFKFYNKNQ
jgi:hypothetical protein